MRKAGALFALLAPAALATAVHCGGSRAAYTSDASADGTTADGVAGDAGSADSACVFGFCDEPPVVGPFAPCSQTKPEAGTPCITEGELCEYGGDFLISCNTTLVCGSGTWRVIPGGSCLPIAAGEAGACPPTWIEAGALVGSGSCPASSCQYPEGYCDCLSYCGSGGQLRLPRVTGDWQCKPATPGCPSPRPLVGTACDVDAGCEYGWSCGCGEGQSCVQGVWQGEATPGCP